MVDGLFDSSQHCFNVFTIIMHETKCLSNAFVVSLHCEEINLGFTPTIPKQPACLFISHYECYLGSFSDCSLWDQSPAAFISIKFIIRKHSPYFSRLV